MTNRSPGSKDGRVTSTIAIWTCATIMLIVTIAPIMFAMENSQVVPILDMGGAALFFLPMVVLIGASLGTGAVWFFGKAPSLALGNEVKAIEDRLANLETIISYEESDLKAKVQRLRSMGPG